MVSRHPLTLEYRSIFADLIRGRFYQVDSDLSEGSLDHLWPNCCLVGEEGPCCPFLTADPFHGHFEAIQSDIGQNRRCSSLIVWSWTFQTMVTLSCVDHLLLYLSKTGFNTERHSKIVSQVPTHHSGGLCLSKSCI